MANPPGSSVVFKTPVQSPIQKALSASQKRATVNASAGVWDPHQDPIVGPAPVAGFHLTRSGKVVGQNGIYARGISAQAVGNAGANEQPAAAPLDPGFGAGASALTAGIGKRPAVAASAKPAAAIAVHVHPTKGITVTHAPAAAAPVPSSAPPVAPTRPAAPTPAPPKQRVPAGPATTTVGAGGGAAAAPPTDQATASSVINSILAPVIKEIQDAATQRSAEGTQAIGGYTTNAENQLKGLDFSTPYAGAAAGENAINTALLARLTGAGSGLQTELGGKLAALNSPDTAARIGGDIAATTSGAANAGLAKGDATLSQLLSEGANAKTYGTKLPGITALAGAQDTGKLQGQVTSDEKTQLAGLESKVPGMVQSELTTLANSRASAAKTRAAEIIAEGYDPATGQLTPKARAELASATGTDPVTGKPTAKTQIAQTRQTVSAEKASKPNAGLSGKLGILVDSNGKQIAGADGKPIVLPGFTYDPKTGTATKSGTVKPPSAPLLREAGKDAENLFHGVAHQTASGGQIVDSYSQTYQDALKTMQGRYPTLGKQAVIAMLNRWYAPGGTFPDGTPNGRPALSDKQQKIANSLFPDPLASLGG